MNKHIILNKVDFFKMKLTLNYSLVYNYFYLFLTQEMYFW